jgi:hypothetical protein
MARTRTLLDLAEKKTGDPVLPVLAQDLVQLGVIAPRDAMMIEARDLREQSQNTNLRKPTGVEDARQAAIRMLNLARDGATIDPVAAQALVDLAKRTVGVKYVRSKEFLDAVTSVESIIKTAKQTADYTKILETDPLNVRALQGRADCAWRKETSKAHSMTSKNPATHWRNRRANSAQTPKATSATSAASSG